MKKNILLLGMVALLSLAGTSLISCNKGDDDDDDDDVVVDFPALKKAALEAMDGGWTQSEITQNGNTELLVSDVTTTPTITFAADLETGENNTYSVTNGHKILPNASNVAFEFVENTSYGAVTLDGVVVGVSASASALTLTREVDTELTSGRTAYVGTWVLTMTKN